MKVAIAAATITLMVLMPLAAAQASGLPTPAITPDSPLYGLSTAVEQIQLLLTFNAVDKAKLHYQFAEERLASAQIMAQEGKVQLSEKALSDYENELNATNNNLEVAVATGKNATDLTNEISDNSVLHIQALNKIHDELPATAQANVNKNIAASLTSQAKAVSFVNHADLVNMTITVGNQTVTIQVPSKFADSIISRAQNFFNRETIAVENVAVMESDIKDKIAECQDEINNLSGKQLDNAGQTLLSEAEKHIDNANLALNDSKLGTAVGQATAACANAENAAKHIAVAVTPTPVATTPVVSTEASLTSGKVPLTVQFTCSAEEGTIPYTYAWMFGDGTRSTNQNPSHTYSTSGVYTATCTVTDSVAKTGSSNQMISVTSLPTAGGY